MNIPFTTTCGRFDGGAAADAARAAVAAAAESEVWGEGGRGSDLGGRREFSALGVAFRCTVGRGRGCVYCVGVCAMGYVGCGAVRGSGGRLRMGSLGAGNPKGHGAGNVHTCDVRVGGVRGAKKVSFGGWG